MKFQDSSFNGLKVTVGTKSVTTHTRTHARSKSNMPHQLFQSWGHNQKLILHTRNPLKRHIARHSVINSLKVDFSRWGLAAILDLCKLSELPRLAFLATKLDLF